MDTTNKKLWLILKLIILITLIILLLTIVRPILVNQDTYQKPIAYLDSKMANAKALTLGTTSASFVVSMIPDDAGTPIANELAQFSGYLLLVLSAIFLERYLLTTIGFISSSIILPASCIFAIMAALAAPENKTKFKEYSYRLLIFGICAVLVIPVGCFCGREIEKANAQSIEMALADAKEAEKIAESIPDEGQGKNIFDKVGDFFSSLWNSASEAYDWAQTVLSNFLSSIAVMLVTTIAIPLLIVFCFLWLIKFLTKRDFVIAIVGYADKFTKSAKENLLGLSSKRNNQRRKLNP